MNLATSCNDNRFKQLSETAAAVLRNMALIMIIINDTREILSCVHSTYLSKSTYLKTAAVLRDTD